MKDTKKWVITAIFFLLALLGSFLIFAVQTSRIMDQNIKNRLKENARNDVKIVQTMFQKDEQFLSGIAAVLARKDRVDAAENIRILDAFQTSNKEMKLVLYLPDGTSVNADGVRDRSAKRNDWDPLEAQETVITDVKVNGRSYLAVIVPVVKDNHVVGALQGTYQSNEVMNSMMLTSFDGSGYYNMVDAEGNILIQSPVVKEIYKDGTLFQTLTESGAEGARISEEIKQKIQAGKSFEVSYMLPDGERHAYFSRVGIQKWYIMTVVPASYLDRQKRTNNELIVMLMLILLSVFALVLIVIARYSLHSRKRLEEERDYLRRVLNGIPIPILLIDKDRKINFVNAVAEEVFQESLQELIHQPCCRLQSKICQTEECPIHRLEKTGDGSSYFEKDGKSYMVKTAVINSSHEYIEVMQDVTDISNTKKILEEKTLELETMSENLAGGILITSLDEGFTVIRCNQGYLEIVGSSEEEIIGKPAISWVASDDVSATNLAIRNQLESRNYVVFEHKIIRKDGGTIWVSLRGREAGLYGDLVGVWMITDITNIKEAEQELKISEERYRIAAQNTEDTIVDYDIRTKIIFHTEKAVGIYGVQDELFNGPERLIQYGIILPKYVDEFREMFQRIDAGEPKASCVIQARRADGCLLWNRLTFTSIFDSEGVPVRAIGIIQDITREREVERQYEQEARYRKMTVKDAALYYEMDLTQHIFVTGHEKTITKICGKTVSEYDEVLDMLINHMVYEEDRELVDSRFSRLNLIETYRQGNEKVEFEYRRSLGDNEIRWVECLIYLIREEETEDLKSLCYIKDINTSKLRELELMQKAEKDLLTNIYNKITLQTKVSDYVKEANDSHGAFLLVDVDDFKTINDTLGHAIGDHVLAEIAGRLSEIGGDSDLVGRVGGDEFALCMMNTNSMEEVVKKAEAVCRLFHSIKADRTSNYQVSGSVGVALFPEHGASFKRLYQRADQALYYAKKNGKNRYCIYKEGL